MNTTDSKLLATPKELALTYRVHEKPWTVVNQYNKFLEITAENPDLGSTAVARKIAEWSDYQCPRGRVRTWSGKNGPKGRPEREQPIPAAGRDPVPG